MANRPYSSLFSRLVANTAEPPNEQACWLWTAKRDRSGYGRVNIYVPGLKQMVILMSHLVAYVEHHAQPANADDLYLGYLELIHSGLELDHLCSMPACIFIDHVEPVTPSENCRRRDERRASGRW